MKGFSDKVSVLHVIDLNYSNITKTEQRVATYIRENQEKIIYETITDVAEKTNASEASIIRLCRKLGYKGFQELKISIAKDFVKPIEKINERISEDDTAESILSKSFQGAIDALEATKNVVSVEGFERAAEAIVNVDKLYVFGLGSSASVAKDIAHKFLRCGINSYASTDNHHQMIAATVVKSGDVVIGVSHSGNSRDIVEAMGYAKENGATTISITNNARSPITKKNVSDINLFTSSPETKFRIYGLTSRMAQLAIADALFIYVSVKKGDEAIKNFEKVDESLSIKKY